jgi:hypothetical protein
MALNDNKTGFGFDIKDRFKKVTGNDNSGNETVIADNSTHTHKPTRDYKHNDIDEPEQRERKQKRVQLLTYESLISRMDAYAEKRGVSRVAVFEAAVNAYLDKVDPQ